MRQSIPKQRNRRFDREHPYHAFSLRGDIWRFGHLEVWRFGSLAEMDKMAEMDNMDEMRAES